MKFQKVLILQSLSCDLSNPKTRVKYLLSTKRDALINEQKEIHRK